MTRPPVALTIAGTDPSGGAGVQADLKTFAARGVYGTSVMTALVAQNTHGVNRIYGISEDFVRDQLDSVFDDMPVDALKTGMLGTKKMVELLGEYLCQRAYGCLVVDPVMVATSGHRLLAEDATEAYREVMVPLSDILTPNIPEAALLLGEDVPPATTVHDMRSQAEELCSRGATAVLLKGGHLGTRSSGVHDVLALRTGEGRGIQLHEFSHDFVSTPHTHGTGCTLSAAITAHMATAYASQAIVGSIPEAIGEALDYMSRAVASGARWSLAHEADGSHGPVNHLVDSPLNHQIDDRRSSL